MTARTEAGALRARRNNFRFTRARRVWWRWLWQPALAAAVLFLLGMAVLGLAWGSESRVLIDYSKDRAAYYWLYADTVRRTSAAAVGDFVGQVEIIQDDRLVGRFLYRVTGCIGVGGQVGIVFRETLVWQAQQPTEWRVEGIFIIDSIGRTICEHGRRLPRVATPARPLF